jgi:hypothetical protein
MNLHGKRFSGEQKLYQQSLNYRAVQRAVVGNLANDRNILVGCSPYLWPLMWIAHAPRFRKGTCSRQLDCHDGLHWLWTS